MHLVTRVDKVVGVYEQIRGYKRRDGRMRVIAPGDEIRQGGRCIRGDKRI